MGQQPTGGVSVTAEEIWRAKSDEDLVLAGKQLSEYTALGQAIILAELDRRQIERPILETQGTHTIRWPRRVYNRIGGVVALFCFGLLVTAPILAIRLLGFLIALVVYNRSVRALWSEAAIDAAAGIALIAFGIVVGVQLLRIRPSAVKLTMVFLACTVGYQVFGAFVPLVFGHALRMSQVRDVGLAAVLASLWATYFKMSKRVAATYRASSPEPSNTSLQPTSGAHRSG
jgi:hypothetical protein